MLRLLLLVDVVVWRKVETTWTQQRGVTMVVEHRLDQTVQVQRVDILRVAYLDLQESAVVERS